MTTDESPPRFGETGIAIGKAVKVQLIGQVTFPLPLSLAYDPLEPHAKGVEPELIRPFYYDAQTGRWSTSGLTLTKLDRSAGVVEFETTHLTVFRLGVPRGTPPLIHAMHPPHVHPEGRLVLLGTGFSPVAAQNVLTLGGAYVSIALDGSGSPQPLELSDGGEAISLQDASGAELDHAQFAAAPSSRSSWTRSSDGDEEAAFVEHRTVASGRLFSPGTMAGGATFPYRGGSEPHAPLPGQLVINEVLLAPPTSFLGDANGDGETVPKEDEFIELVNTTAHVLILEGCTLQTSQGARHQFPEGTLLPGGMALVVFGVDDPAHPPQPAGPFGGKPFLPDESSATRLLARLPEGTAPGTALLTVTSFRQTSNPVSLQILSRPIDGHPLFVNGAALLPSLVGRHPRLVRAADLDRDLDVDLVAADADDGILVLRNDGGGRFEEAQGAVVLPIGGSRFFDLALADLTEDGAPELILGQTNDSGSITEIMVLKNNGAGQFSFHSQSSLFNSTASIGPSTLAVGDVDQDGDADVAVGLVGDRPILFRNDGSAQFAHNPATDVIPQQTIVAPTQLRFADLDDDGDLDLVLGASLAGLGSGSALQLFRNNGTGQFEDVTLSHLPLNRQGIDALALGDLDGDVDLDLASGSRAKATRLYLNDGTGHLTEGGADRLTAQGARALALADLDNDGDADLASARPPRDEAFLNDGTGRFDALEPLPLIGGNHLEVIATDVDNDGDVDLVGAGSSLTLLLNTSSEGLHPPTFAPVPEQFVIEGNPLQVTVLATDVDGDTITLSARLPSGEPVSALGASFADQGGGRGLFAWTPGPEQGLRGGRAYDVIVRASDGSLSQELTIRIAVHDPNVAPTLDPVAPMTVNEGQPVAIVLTGHDADLNQGDELTFGTSGAPGGATIDNTTGVFEWTPSATQGDGPGGQRVYAITFTVTDLAHATDSQQTTITVLDINSPPAFTPIAPAQVMEGQTLEFTVQVSDPDGDDVILSHELPFGASFDTGSRQFSWTPDFLQSRAEPYVARFEASDGKVSVALAVEITVLDHNRPPRFVNLTDKLIGEEMLLQFTVNVEDPDGDVPTVSVVGDPPSGATFDPGSRQFQWTPTPAQVGDHDVIFRVSDVQHTVEQTIRISVRPASGAPILTPIGDQTVREGELLQVSIPVTDPDGDAVTVTVEPLPSGAQVLHPGEPFIFQWVPGAGQAGSYPLEVRASDGLNVVTESFTVTVEDNPGFQWLVAQVGAVSGGEPLGTPLGFFGEIRPAIPQTAPLSLGLDLGSVHPARVSLIELFATEPVAGMTEQDVQLFVSDDNAAYSAYAGPLVFSSMGRKIVLSNLDISKRYIKVHLPGRSAWPNFLSESVRASGAIPLDAPLVAFLDDLGQRTFNYFKENVNTNGLIPDRVIMSDGQPAPGAIYSTGATGFWLASLPIAVQRGWITQEEGAAFARLTLKVYLGVNGEPVEGSLGFYHHFLNGDGTQFTGFSGDGVSILDSSILFLGALACGEYFGGDIRTLAEQLYDRADWDGFYDHEMNMLRLFRHADGTFVLHLNYTSEGILAYLLAAGSTTHPIQPDADLASGADAYYAFSRGNFGRVLGRFGRDGRPLLQSYVGSLFTYLYPVLLMDWAGDRDAIHIDWRANAREAAIANFQFAQSHPGFGYGRLVWGISASDGPAGYQGLYGTPPLDPGAAGGPRHDGTVTPYALAGSLSLAADLALPALQHLAALQSGRLFDRYGLKDGVNIGLNFFANGYLGIDQGALLLGVEQYRTGMVGRLVRQSAVMQRALEALGIQAAGAYRLADGGPRGAYAYLPLDTTDHLTQTIVVERGDTLLLPGQYLLELHPYGIDTALDEGFVDAELAINGEFVTTVRFLDQRGDGVVDVGSVYVPIHATQLQVGENTITLTWAGGERWVQLKDVTLNLPTGRLGTQDFWQIGQRNNSSSDFGDERLTDDSYLVGEDTQTFEQALNVVDEPRTDILIELGDAGVDRMLRLAARETQDGKPVTVEVSINHALAGQVVLHSGEEATVSINHTLLREGWNHLVLRQLAVSGDGQYIVWDALTFERQAGTPEFDVVIRNVIGDEPALSLSFGFAPPEGAVLSGLQYLEVHYIFNDAFDLITISTDNRNAELYRFTGPLDVSAAGLVNLDFPVVTAPLLWQVYDQPRPSAPAFTNTIEWAFVPDASDATFGDPGAVAYRTILNRSGLGDRPSSGRSASSPIMVYFVADFRNAWAGQYGVDRLFIERVKQ